METAVYLLSSCKTKSVLQALSSQRVKIKCKTCDSIDLDLDQSGGGLSWDVCQVAPYRNCLLLRCRKGSVEVIAAETTKSTRLRSIREYKTWYMYIWHICLYSLDWIYVSFLAECSRSQQVDNFLSTTRFVDPVFMFLFRHKVLNSSSSPGVIRCRDFRDMTERMKFAKSWGFSFTELNAGWFWRRMLLSPSPVSRHGLVVKALGW